MRGLKYQLAPLADVIDTPSETSDHRSFAVPSAWSETFVASPAARHGF